MRHPTQQEDFLNYKSCIQLILYVWCGRWMSFSSWRKKRRKKRAAEGVELMKKRRKEANENKLQSWHRGQVLIWHHIPLSNFKSILYAYAHIMASNCTSSVGKQQGGGWGTSRDREHMSVIKFVKGNITNYFNVSLCVQWGRERRTHSGWRL